MTPVRRSGAPWMSDVNHVTHHGRSSTSVTYTQESTCALWRLTTMGLPFDVESSRAFASAVWSPLNSRFRQRSRQVGRTGSARVLLGMVLHWSCVRQYRPGCMGMRSGPANWGTFAGWEIVIPRPVSGTSSSQSHVSSRCGIRPEVVEGQPATRGAVT